MLTDRPRDGVQGTRFSFRLLQGVLNDSGLDRKLVNSELVTQGIRISDLRHLERCVLDQCSSARRVRDRKGDTPGFAFVARAGAAAHQNVCSW